MWVSEHTTGQQAHPRADILVNNAGMVI